jgi:hypothetical protein
MQGTFRSSAPPYHKRASVWEHDDVSGGVVPVARASGARRMFAAVPYLPVVGFVIDLAIRSLAGVDDWEQTALEVGVLWLIGINGIILGSGHLFQPGPVAASIGWASSPFQWEVGLANVAIGVLGITASAFDRDYTLAAILAFSIFMVGAAVGHIRSMVREHNFAPGNAGYFFWYDIIVPALLIALYAATA